MAIELIISGAVATLVLQGDDEGRSGLTANSWRQLQACLVEVGESSEIRVLVLRGASADTFSPGADIKDLRGHQRSEKPEAFGDYKKLTRGVISALAGLDRPTIALIRGSCQGGGCALATACDLRVADSTARFTFPSARLDLVYPTVSTRLLVELVGPSRAKYLLFTAREIDAVAALSMGLINELVEPDAVVERTLALAAEIAALNPLSHRDHKRLVRLLLDGESGTESERIELESYRN